MNHENKLISPLLFKGTTDTKLVLWWVENMLLPELPKNSMLIWDNASFHKSQALRELVEESGHTMIFLPAYSPDLNPIEHKWYELKQRLRSFYDNALDFIDNLVRELRVISGWCIV